MSTVTAEKDHSWPPAGTYALARIMEAPDGKVLDIDGKSQPLSRYTQDKVTVLSFIYTSCADSNGCPLAYHVFYNLKNQLDKSPALRDQVRLVSLSFDPEHDTPEVMRHYAGAGTKTGVRWEFLTTSSTSELRPLLEAFGQDVSVLRDPPRNASRAFSHVLKVFLIDKGSTVREIYSTSYLSPQLLLNDITTLLMEHERPDQTPMADSRP